MKKPPLPVLLAGGAVLAVLLGVTAALLPGLGGGGAQLSDTELRLPVAPDRQPTPKPFSAPADCGVSPQTLARVAPGAVRRGNSADDGCVFGPPPNTLETYFQVSVSYLEGRDHEGRASLGDAIGLFEAGSDDTGVKNVSGLGDEAKVSYDDNGLAEVEVRVSAVVLKVGYRFDRKSGFDYIPLDEKPATDNALAVAADAVRALGGAVGTPVVAPPASGAPALPLPKACSAVPEEVLRRLGLDPADPTSINLGGYGDAAEDDCYWHDAQFERQLQVDVSAYPDRPDAKGERLAKRHFLRDYDELRMGNGRRSTAERSEFHPLSGPGDEAFAYWYQDGSDDKDMPRGHGVVEFRIRNLLFTVEFEGVSGSTPLGPATTLNRAYHAAEAIAEGVAP